MSESARGLLEKLKSKLLEPITIPKKELNLFLRQFSHLLEAGILPNDALRELSKEQALKNTRKILERMNERVEAGWSLSEAFGVEKVFDPLLVSMVRTGEMTGELPFILRKISTFYEKELKIERKIKGALTYPIILMISLFFVLMVLFSHVIPTFVLFFESAGEELPFLTRLLISLANKRTYFLVFFILLLGGILLFFLFSRRDEKLRLTWDTWTFKLGLFKNLRRQRRTAELFYFLYLISLFGVDLMEGLEIIIKGEKNYYVKEKLLSFTENLRLGHSLSKSLKGTNIYDDLGLLLLRTGEESSNITKTLEYAIKFYEEEIDYSIEKAMAILQPFIILVMAGIVGFIVLAIGIPLFDLMNTVPV